MQGAILKRVLFLLFGTILISWGAHATAKSAGSIWGKDYFPNVPLITQDGKTVHFFDDLIKDKVVAINFIFTRCPDSCPLETARLREVQKLLGDRVGKDVFMYSITIEPDYDTPERLKEYMKAFEVGPGWTFLTGKNEDIVLLRQKLGLYNEEEEGGRNLKAHNLSLILGNQSTGQWVKSSPFENPYIIATKLGSWLTNWKLPSKKKRSYADAPELRKISQGEEIFRTRCSACHAIGLKEPENSGKRFIGPDLYGVTKRRNREWLVSFMAAPDKMLAEKDPQTMILFNQYNNVAMPNLQLGHIEIERLLAYIQEETDRLDRVERESTAQQSGPKKAAEPAQQPQAKKE